MEMNRIWNLIYVKSLVWAIYKNTVLAFREKKFLFQRKEQQPYNIRLLEEQEN